MKKQLFLIMALGFLCTGLLSAQETAQSSLVLQWGMGHLKKQDLTFSPMIHSSWSPIQIELAYQRSKRLEQRVSVHYSEYTSQLDQAFTFYSFYNGEGRNYPHNFSLLEINYALGKPLVSTADWQFILGARSSNSLFLSAYEYGPSGSTAYYYSFALELWLDVQCQFDEKQRFEVELAAPAIAFNSRSPYLTQDDPYFEDIYSHRDLASTLAYIKRGEWQSWGKSQKVTADLRYSYALIDNLELGIGYGLSLNANQKPARFVQVEQAFYLTGKVNF